MKDQFIWEPSPEFIERTNVRRLMRRLGLATYQDFVRYSQEHLEQFWDEIALEVGIDWYQARDRPPVCAWRTRSVGEPAGSPRSRTRALRWRSSRRAWDRAYTQFVRPQPLRDSAYDDVERQSIT